LTKNRKSLSRRLLPLGLSLALHALLLACAALSPSSRREVVKEVVAPPTPLSLTVSWGDAARPRSARDPGIELPDDFVPRIVSPHDKGVEVNVSAFPTPGEHGGGGAADGSRGGEPAGTGARPSILSAPQRAKRVAYVIDRSMSMGSSGALERARAEVVLSLRALPPDARFQIVVYNRYAQPLPSSGWLTPDAQTLAAVERRLDELTASGSTDHVRALRQALVARPDVLFWVTDADDLTESAVRDVTRLNNGGASIQVVELRAGRGDPGSLLTRLAADNRGAHRRVAP
jgi:hypothetical protein